MAVRFEDLISPEVKARVASRNAELATEAGESETKIFSKPLKAHIESGVLAVGVFDEMVETERLNGMRRYLAERQTGQQNDKISLGLGFTALVVATPTYLVGHILERMRITDEPEFGSAQIVGLEDIEGLPSPLVALRAPEGVFVEARDESMSFTARSQIVGDILVIPSLHDITIASAYVAQIIGDSGEFWTNPKPSSLVSSALFEARAASF